jgi:hypothetical protein
MERQVAAVAAHLGAVCGRKRPYESAQALLDGLVNGQQDAETIFRFTIMLRKSRRHRSSIAAVKRYPGLRRHCLLVDAAWSLYCLMRRRATPLGSMPKMARDVDLPRSQLRAEIKAGKAHHSCGHLANRANRAARKTWLFVHRKPVVLWIDNYFYGTSAQRAPHKDPSQNATAMAMFVQTDAFPYFAGQPALRELYRAIGGVATQLRNEDRRIPSTLRTLRADANWATLRCPLDKLRDPKVVTGPKWRPLMLTPEVISSTKGLVNSLRFAADMKDHLSGLVPVLVDENIHYRTLKLLYGQKMAQWRVPEALRHVPLLYGVWHAYKFCVTHVARRFYPLVVYFRKGTLKPGEKVSMYPEFATVEHLFAALLKASGMYLHRLRRKVEALRAQRNQSSRHMNRYYVASAVQLLITEYIPVLVQLGTLVRDCGWQHNRQNTGDQAQKVLKLAFVILSQLQKSAGGRGLLKYQQTVGASLLYAAACQPWTGKVAGQASQEEFGEIGLKLLRSAREGHKNLKAVPDVDNLYQKVRVKQSGGGVGFSRINPHTVSALRLRLARLTRCDRIVVSYCPWSSQSTALVRATWPLLTAPLAPTLSEPLSQDVYKTLLQRILQTLIRQTKWKRGTARFFDAVLPHRSDAEQVAYAEQVRRTLQRLQDDLR